MPSAVQTKRGHDAGEGINRDRGDRRVSEGKVVLICMYKPTGGECLLAPSGVGRGLGRAMDNEVGKRSKISYSVTPTLVPDACHGCRCILHQRPQL